MKRILLAIVLLPQIAKCNIPAQPQPAAAQVLTEEQLEEHRNRWVKIIKNNIPETITGPERAIIIDRALRFTEFMATQPGLPQNFNFDQQIPHITLLQIHIFLPGKAPKRSAEQTSAASTASAAPAQAQAQAAASSASTASTSESANK